MGEALSQPEPSQSEALPGAVWVALAVGVVLTGVLVGSWLPDPRDVPPRAARAAEAPRLDPEVPAYAQEAGWTVSRSDPPAALEVDASAVVLRLGDGVPGPLWACTPVTRQPPADLTITGAFEALLAEDGFARVVVKLTTQAREVRWVKGPSADQTAALQPFTLQVPAADEVASALLCLQAAGQGAEVTLRDLELL